MASESHNGVAWRSKARCADCPSQRCARPLHSCLPPSACLLPIRGCAACAVSLPVRATATKSISEYAVESIPPAGRSGRASRPVGSTPTSRAHTAAQRPAVGYWFGSDSFATSPVLLLCTSPLQTLRGRFGSAPSFKTLCLLHFPPVNILVGTSSAAQMQVPASNLYPNAAPSDNTAARVRPRAAERPRPWHRPEHSRRLSPAQRASS
jgi:hypothetical protein